MFSNEKDSPPRSSSSQRPLSPPIYELDNMSRNDAIVTVTDPHYAQNYPMEEKKQQVHISATEMPDPRHPKRPGMGRRDTTNDFGKRVEADHQLTAAGQAFFNLIDNPVIRYCIYILPVAAIIAIPLVIYAAVPGYNQQTKEGIRLLGLFIWLEVVWVSFWIAKLMAVAVPYIFQTVCGIFSTGIRKYALVLRACELPVSLFIWSIMMLLWYPIIYIFSREIYVKAHQTIPAHGTVAAQPGPGIAWLSIIHKICKATIGVTALYLAEKLLIQLISVNYHNRQFQGKIRNIKRTSAAVDLLYDASLRRFPDHHRDFQEEDYDIHDTSGLQKLGRQQGADRATMKFLGDMGWLSEKITTAFGHLASDITGKQIRPTASHAIVEQALERKYAAEALARRIFKALVSPGESAITEQDIIDELGPEREEESRFIFQQLDRDGNGDVSLEEMVSLVGGISRERKAMWRSVVDIKEALKILDRALETVVAILILLIYAAFFSTYLAKNYTSIWGTFTGLGFMLGPTASELLSACILVFVKHPYDIGDRVDMNNIDLEVIRISLLYTTFRRIDSERVVQVPNSVINTLWTENTSRSAAMKERLNFAVSASTSFDDIETLRRELEAFVVLPENKRDFFPDVDIELISVGDLKQLDLRVEIRHKSNWADEKLRAYRRSKFMCALLSAMRKVPIDPPGGSGPAGGSIANPNYSVAISDADAQASKKKFDADKNAKRLFPNDSSVIAGISSGLNILPSLVKRNESNAGLEMGSNNPFNSQPAQGGIVYRNVHYPPRVDVSIRLRRAVTQNDLPLVQRILRTYPRYIHNADHADKCKTSLHLAAQSGYYEIAEFIVTFAQAQDEVNAANGSHLYSSSQNDVGLTYTVDVQTPLHYAASNSHARIADLLCKHFPRSIEKKDKQGRTALHLASRANASPSRQSPTNSTFAASTRNIQEDISTLQVLLSHRADVSATDAVGSTPLHYATAWGNLKAVRVLIQAGADPLCPNTAGWQPEYYSVTVAAEVYFKNLVADWSKHRAEEGARARERRAQGRAGVRLVSSEDGIDEDNGSEGTADADGEGNEDGRSRADSGTSGASRVTTSTESGLGISVGQLDSWR